ncbi:MASE4 domain-containing protein [Roseateles sp. SL47]|uniref:ATP-binding protein n=1 Tax=Roseateles sp. SL47 TaxID=2995138 RepID=UPI002271031A|nr:ATP-binding protein [Roseateles sp. SL47]WAC72321.1 MASE4 domain-containing protein [Roseateles sp. SL47]
MAYPEVVEELASPSQLRLAIGLSVLLLAVIAIIFPDAATPLVQLPHVSGMYGSAIAMIDLATFWLLISSSHQPRSHAVIAAAYLFGGLMAVLHVLTFPGAVFIQGPVIGSPHAVSWLFVAWRAGFAFFIIWAVLVEGRGQPSRSGRSSRLPAVVAVIAAAAVYTASQLSDAAALATDGHQQRFSNFSVYGAYLAAVLAVLAIGLIWLRELHRRSIFVWLMFVMTAEAAGVWLSTYSGGRYTLAWYTTRVEGLVASAVVLLLLAQHFRRLQRHLGDTVAVLKARTDDLQAEIHRRESAEAKLAQAKKMEAVGQLGAGLSHDLNNILQVITGRLSILHRRAGALADADVEVIRRNVRKAEAMTRQLTLLSGRRRMNAQPLNLAAALADIADSLRPLLDGRYPVTLDLAPQLPDLALDPLELEIALTNLMTNARDAMPEGGEIRLSACVETLGEAGRVVLIVVTDGGAGMRPEVLDRIFDPFFTTKEPGKGTGLGLAQVYGFAKASGGHVEVTSRPGQGTTVTMVFPLGRPEGQARPAGLFSAAGPANGGAPAMGVQGAELRSDDPDPLAASPIRSGEVILLVDDNDDVREASQQLLAAGGFAVRTARHAPEALSLIAAGLRPDVLISDIVMPGGMNGVELARRIKDSHPDVRVVLVTGFSDVAQSASEEGYPVVRKPYDLASLLSVLA